jgi:hypothetical protein
MADLCMVGATRNIVNAAEEALDSIFFGVEIDVIVLLNSVGGAWRNDLGRGFVEYRLARIGLLS